MRKRTKQALQVTSLLIGVLLLIAGYAVLNDPLPASETTKLLTSEQKAEQYTLAPELVEPNGFINADPFTLESLRGDKVVLLDIWTYSCINCQRTVPYLNAWYEKYKDDGLVIVGVHSPEFTFEKNRANVQDAVERLGIKYPVVMDNDFTTWRAYENSWWPRKFLIDVDGYVVYDHIGEGGYEETESVLQQLLRERQQRLGLEVLSDDVKVAEVEVEVVAPGLSYTPEIYLGAWRNERTLGNGVANVQGVQQLVVPQERTKNMVYHQGMWRFENEYAQPTKKDARIVLPYQAGKVFLVSSADRPVRVQVLLDGVPIGAAAGSDVVDGYVTIDEERLYRIVEDPAGWGERTLELIIEDPGLRVYTFTFG